jgi:histone H3/H4
MLAICNDEELNRMLHQSSIARGGIFPTEWPSATGMPYSHHDFKHPRSSGAGGMEARSEVLRRLVAESRSSCDGASEDIGGAVVHPITGFHVAARPEAKHAMADRDSSEDPLDAREALVFAPEAKSDTLTDERGEEFIPSRLYRTLRARTACDHRALAVAVLNDPPASTLLRRIREEQQQTSLVFQRVPFAHLVFEVAQDFKPNVRCTPQALDAIQTATESFLVGLFQDTSLIAALPPFHGYIDARRIQLARRIRGERD